MKLVALMMENTETAQKARVECAAMAKEQLIRLEDAVVVYRDEKGDVKLDQAVNLTSAGALSGAWWGVVMGAVLGIFTGVPGMALAGAAGGAAGGAIGGHFSDVGVSDEMMKEAAQALDQGKAILFLLGRTGAPDKVLERLAPYGGTVVTSNLSADADARINAALSKAA
ncbi:DUF1269 domain-containing protein [Seohaeicola saemankumensis]|nr:DUF1269 domain-containing protein [Seohaeicola saemankumensis]MCA0871473.1 DUF1269 domain-containing protein [Seohaeicola saemankumensis]